MQSIYARSPANPTEDGITVADVTRRHAVLRYLWPLWSRRQTVFMLTLFSTAGTAVIAILWRFDPDFIPIGLCCGFAGGMSSVYCAMPARLLLTTRGEARHFIADIDREVVALGAVRILHPDEPERHHYRAKLPAWLEWTNFPEGYIEFRIAPHTITIDGPVFGPNCLRRRILNRKEN